jgi:hypothetical protein
LTEEQPLQILVEFAASRSPREWLDDNFLPIAFNVLAEKREGVLDVLVNLAHAAASLNAA